MKKSLAISLVLLLLVLGGAGLLYERLFGASSSTTTPVGATDDPVATATTTTTGGPSDTPTASVDGGVAVASARGVGDAGAAGATTTGSESPTATGPRTAIATMVQGFVEMRAGAAEAWKKLAVNDALNDDDAVRTGRNGEAHIRLSDGIVVRLSPRSEFTIRELAAGASRVRLETGHVSAAVDSSKGEVLRVEAKGSDAVAETRGGEFGMVTDGAGQVAVATTTGSVNLTARGSTVQVDAGKTSSVTKGEGPSAPVALPSSLLLKVADPVRKTTNARSTVVEGTTSPGALVVAQETTVVADKSGKFRVPVRLADGANAIGVAVVDALGRRKEVALPEIVLDRKKPEIDAQMTWGGN